MCYLAVMEKGKENCKVISMIDARNENAYYAVYRMKDENFSVFKNPGITNISNIPEYVNFQENVYVVGDVELSRIESYLKAKRAKEEAQARDVKKIEFINSNHTIAESLSFIAIEKYNNGLFGDSDSVYPMYLNLSQAEKEKQGLEDEKVYINEMSISDIEEIKKNYEDFPNLWDFSTFLDDTKNSKYLVEKSNQEIIAFVSYRTILGKIEIVNIVTRKDKRNRGAASNLLSYLIRKGKADQIDLEVNANNKTAKNLYIKFGFKKVRFKKKILQWNR